MDILGVKIDNLEKEEIIARLNDFLKEDRFHQIATVNPEFILTAEKDQDFQVVLNECDLRVADGFGLRLAFWKGGEKLKCRLAGADLMAEILKLAEEKNLGVFLAANQDGLSGWQETRDAILKKHPELKIGGMDLNRKMPADTELKIENYEVVFCNFGAPFQEKFLHSLKTEKGGKIRLAMGVGGSFDYWTGKVRRAPKILQKLGLEWLWRLIRQPRRWKKIWNAVIVFAWKIIFK